MGRRQRVRTLVVCALLTTACTAAPAGEMPRSGAAAASAPASPKEVVDATDRWFEPGTHLTIFGIRALLNARVAPGTGSRRLRELYADDEIVAVGPARWADDRWWVQVDLPVHGQSAWVARDLVGVEGRTEHVAHQLPARERPLVGSDVLDLGQRALRDLGYEPEGSATVLSQAPLIIDRRATVAFDVRNVDDAVLGHRILVSGAPVDSPDGRFELMTVERTRVCARGVARDGSCESVGVGAV